MTQVQLYGMDEILDGQVISTSILEPVAVGEDGFSAVKKVGSLALLLGPAGATEGKPFSVQPVLQVRDPEVSATLRRVGDMTYLVDCSWR